MYPKYIRFKDFTDYSCGNEWLTTGSENWADIKDKLVRYTAKYTDSYAGDILHCLNFIQEEINLLNNGQSNFTIIIIFRECGVNWIAEDNYQTDVSPFDSSIRAIFRLYGARDDNDIVTVNLNRVRYYMREA